MKCEHRQRSKMFLHEVQVSQYSTAQTCLMTTEFTDQHNWYATCAQAPRSVQEPHRMTPLTGMTAKQSKLNFTGIGEKVSHPHQRHQVEHYDLNKAWLDYSRYVRIPDWHHTWYISMLQYCSQAIGFLRLAMGFLVCPCAIQQTLSVDLYLLLSHQGLPKPQGSDSVLQSCLLSLNLHTHA